MASRLALVLAPVLAACGGPAASEPLWTEPVAAQAPATDLPEASVAGVWRATLLSPGGELPFSLTLHDRGGVLSGEVGNDEERVSFTTVEQAGTRVRMRFDGYDSEIEATLDDEGRRMTGQWQKTVAEGKSTLPFVAVKGDNRRFLPALDPALETVAGSPESLDGSWALTFTELDGTTYPARAELSAGDGERLRGTILTEAGDYRWLDGAYHRGWLLLSVFDGAHAFLFEARALADGTLAGDFWSRDRYHATFVGKRLGKGERDERSSPWSRVKVVDRGKRLDFDFPDLDGQRVRADDARFEGKVVLVDLFGTWCPNCNDQAPLLTAWYEKYRDQGLEIVGLAYEMTGEAERDRSYVARFRDAYAITFPLLLAGTSDKPQASDTLPDLSEVAAFPTTVFVGRDGKVRRVYTGFAGPATGRHHRKLVEDQTELLEQLLAESPAPGR